MKVAKISMFRLQIFGAENRFLLFVVRSSHAPFTYNAHVIWNGIIMGPELCLIDLNRKFNEFHRIGSMVLGTNFARISLVHRMIFGYVEREKIALLLCGYVSS